MDEATFRDHLADWAERAGRLDEVLHPNVHEEIDFNDPAALERLENAPHPADATGERDAIAALFEEMVAVVESVTAEQRGQLIALLAKNDSLLYSAVLETDPETPEGFRKTLLLFVLEDQGKDTRDAILTLAAYREQGETLGLDVDGLFREMAELASTRNKYGWGSTRDLFLRG